MNKLYLKLLKYLLPKQYLIVNKKDIYMGDGCLVDMHKKTILSSGDINISKYGRVVG